MICIKFQPGVDPILNPHPNSHPVVNAQTPFLLTTPLRTGIRARSRPSGMHSLGIKIRVRVGVRAHHPSPSLEPSEPYGWSSRRSFTCMHNYVYMGGGYMICIKLVQS